MEKDLRADDAPRAGEAGKITSFVKEAISQLRRIARGLAPVEMEEEGLTAALRRLARDTQELFGLICTFSGDALIHDDSVAMNLYHIAQEAVNNAARHAQPSYISITLRADGVSGVLMVEDDGSGFRPGSVSDGGMGLQIMRYRAEMVDGTFEISGRKEGGTIVICRFGNSAKDV